jgi:hypothetical protein
MTAITPDQHGELFLSVILEGPSKWTVRPVCEFFTDDTTAGKHKYSALAGLIWQVKDHLSVDIAFREAREDNHPVSEIRAGLTFSFPSTIFGARPPK